MVRSDAGGDERAGAGAWVDIEGRPPADAQRISMDEPEKLHPELTDPQAWWTFLEAYLVRVALALGFTGDQAQRIARRVHRVQADSRSYHLYPDTLATLDCLKREGYRMIILSNHVPELPQIVRGLGLTDAFEAVLGSAQTAVEKAPSSGVQAGDGNLGKSIGGGDDR